MFGPVAAVFRARDTGEAIRLANDSAFGLGASAWTNDPGERARLIEVIEAGLVFINGMVACLPAPALFAESSAPVMATS